MRVSPGRPGVVAMAVVAVISLVVTGAWVLAARPHRLAAASVQLTSAPQPVSAGGSLMSPLASPSRAATGGVPTGAPAGGSTGGTVIVVDVVGKVRKPGVYRLTAGARVDDAVAAAGGLVAGVNLVTVNLARKLSDGEQVAIGVTVPSAGAGAGVAGSSGGAASAGGAGGGGMAGAPPSAASGTGLVDLNSATAGQLDALPGVGPVLAQRIVDWRTQHTKFDSVDQLQSVSGIGDAKFADLKPLVSVG